MVSESKNNFMDDELEAIECSILYTEINPLNASALFVAQFGEIRSFHLAKISSADPSSLLLFSNASAHFIYILFLWKVKVK